MQCEVECERLWGSFKVGWGRPGFDQSQEKVQEQTAGVLPGKEHSTEE